ncbi:MAG: hypothetical protein EXS63_07775 [Candidatus Omnitrophica bacterium]|nr:hypothetical protein [Candidatus Omnitrophota bacterium]
MKQEKKIQAPLSILILALLASDPSIATAQTNRSTTAELSRNPQNDKEILVSGKKPARVTANPAQEKSGPSSTDFLMGEDRKPLSLKAPEAAPSEQTMEFKKIQNPVQSLRNDIARHPRLRHKKTKPPEEPTTVVMMISETCKNEAGAGNHSVCLRTFSDNSTAEVDTNERTHGKELRQMTTITEFDGGHHLKNVKTIYKGVQYSDIKNKNKEFEFLDISYTTGGGPLYKEVLIYDYHREAGKLKKMTWGRYEQEDSFAEPVLISHAYLTYDQSGTPDKGLAETVEDGNLTAQFLDWHEKSGPAREVSHDAWRGWESWISSRQISIYLT